MIHAFVHISFTSADEGGRQISLPVGARVGYIFRLGSEDFSCWLVDVPEAAATEENSGTMTCGIVFAMPELVLPKLTTGTEFSLRDYRRVATGEVLEIFEPRVN